jgi:hypothetical protein
MAHYAVLTFEGSCAEDVTALRGFFSRYRVFATPGLASELPGPGPYTVRIAATKDALFETANIGLSFVPYAQRKGLRVVTWLTTDRREVTVGPTDMLSTLLAEGEILGRPLTETEDMDSAPPPNTRRVDLYTVLRMPLRQYQEYQEAFFKEKLRDLINEELVHLVTEPTSFVVVAAKEAFSEVLAAGRDYGRLGVTHVPTLCVMAFSTGRVDEAPLTNMVTMWSLQREGYSVGHYLRTLDLPLRPPKAPKAKSPFPVWTEAERAAAIPASERTQPTRPSDAERARAAVTRPRSDKEEELWESAVFSPAPQTKEEESFWTVVEPDPPPKKATSGWPKPMPTILPGEKFENAPYMVTKADTDFGEMQMRSIHQDSLTEILGWKPWKEGDDVVYNGRCQCKLYEATVLAQPCEHMCLCQACYAAYQGHPALAERCPRCNAPVTTYEKLDAPDDFMVVDPPVSRPGQGDDDEKVWIEEFEENEEDTDGK